MNQGKTPNRLLQEKSPYLLQHAYNPVDWFPWGDEAFAKARRENKPIFVSIGYSTCYWCHVMEREVFENGEIARLMNEKLVCIKVDREERPDIDRIYMSAVQVMTGSGGWPMSVFLTPDLKPFYGATYIPPISKYGRPGFPEIVNKISELWQSDHERIFGTSAQLIEYLKTSDGQLSNGFQITRAILDSAFHRFQQIYDPEFGGFGRGPKFPRPVSFNFLFGYYARNGNDSALEMSLTTLSAMARGGMYDHLGGGFHRYSVDGQWRIPHFEKMLYDQAQLVNSYLDAYQISHDEQYAAIAGDVLSYVERKLTDPDGGFYSAEDAESATDASNPDAKEEGGFYCWTSSEIEKIIGHEDAVIFKYRFGVQDAGNALHDPMNVFSGKNILYIAHSIEETAEHLGKPVDLIESSLDNAVKKLFDEREKRQRPHLDDKFITAWNGLMVSAFARAYQILRDPKYLEIATQATEFIVKHLSDSKNRKLFRRYRDGDARFDGGLQDYSFFVSGLLDLYETSFDFRWMELAIELTSKQVELFWDEKYGGFFDTSGTDASLLFRTKEDYDGAEPTGNSVAILNLLRLSQMTDNKDWRTKAETCIKSFSVRLQQMPDALAQMLTGITWLLSSPKEIIIAGNPAANDTKILTAMVYENFMPNKIVMLVQDDGKKDLASYLPFTRHMKMIDGKPTLYVCENYACRLPTNDPETAKQLLYTTVRG